MLDDWSLLEKAVTTEGWVEPSRLYRGYGLELVLEGRVELSSGWGLCRGRHSEQERIWKLEKLYTHLLWVGSSLCQKFWGGGIDLFIFQALETSLLVLETSHILFPQRVKCTLTTDTILTEEVFIMCQKL